MFPSVFDKTRRMSVDLCPKTELAVKKKSNSLKFTFEQLSHVKIVPLFFPPLVSPKSFTRLVPFGEDENTTPSSGTDLDRLSVLAEVPRPAGIEIADAAAMEFAAEVNDVDV